MGKLKPQDPTLRLTTNIKGHPQLPSPDNTSLLIEKIEYRSSFHAERYKLLHYLHLLRQTSIRLRQLTCRFAGSQIAI